MTTLTYSDVVAHKTLSVEDLRAEANKLIKYKADACARSFVGNPILYHYMMAELCECKNKLGKSIRDYIEADLPYWMAQVEKRGRTGTLANRMFECVRVSRCNIAFFKPSIAKWLYKTVGATHVLDPTAGWGGRMLGAWGLGIAYTGIDTNLSLKEPYDAMMAMLTQIKPGNLQMIYEDCLKVDYSQIDYDCVLTSPPYVNLEIYKHMTPWATDADYYKQFLIPLIDKCRASIRRGGRVLFNISPKMYDDLTKKYGYQVCKADYDMLQQKRAGKDKMDRVYEW
jgi:hypothetical protein